MSNHKYQGLLGVPFDPNFWRDFEEAEPNAEEHTGVAIQEVEDGEDESDYNNPGPSGKRTAKDQQVDNRIQIHQNLHYQNGELTPNSKNQVVPYKGGGLTAFWETFTAGAETAVNIATGNYLGAVGSGIKTAKGISDLVSQSQSPDEGPKHHTTQALVHRNPSRASSSRSEITPYQRPMHRTPQIADTPGNTGIESMDTAGGSGQEVAAGPSAVPAKAGSGPGSGAVGAAGMQTPSVYTGNPISPTGIPFKRDYIKSYRYILPACKSRLFKVPSNYGDSTDGELINGEETFFLKVASSAYIPMEYLFLYLDPREYQQIYAQYTNFQVHRVGAKITTLGIRAPYTTGASNIEVANANLQATLVDLTPMAEAYPIVSGGTDRPDMERNNLGNDQTINQTFNQMMGSVFATDGGGGVQSSINIDNFDNVSSRFETRRWHPRAWVVLPERTHNGFAIGSQSWVDGYHHSWPNYTHFIEKMINGSNHLGLAFMKQYTINRKLWERTQQAHRWPNNSVPNNNTDVQYNDQQYLNGRYTQDITKTADRRFTTTRTQPTAPDFSNFNEAHDQTGITPYRNADIWGPTTVAEGEPDRMQAPFIFAMYNVRNITTDVASDISTGSPANDIVDLNLEFILDVCLEASGSMEIPIYFNPTLRPTPKWTKKRQIWTEVGNGRRHLIVENRFKKYLNSRQVAFDQQNMGNNTITQRQN